MITGIGVFLWTARPHQGNPARIGVHAASSIDAGDEPGWPRGVRRAVRAGPPRRGDDVAALERQVRAHDHSAVALACPAQA
ncbi:MAG: hypothetical protein LC644_05990, partial [Pseudonocardia sp.]|nr:hypothetical protein [Pseudonocardia sp.]